VTYFATTIRNSTEIACSSVQIAPAQPNDSGPERVKTWLTACTLRATSLSPAHSASTTVTSLASSRDWPRKKADRPSEVATGHLRLADGAHLAGNT